MPYNADHLITLAELKQTAQAFKVESDKAIKYIAVLGNSIKFFTNEDGSSTPAFSVDFPTELFLDQTRTQFIANFAFTAASYPGAQNPSLDGKPVLVFAVKNTTDRTSGTANDSFTYSFMDMSSLVDTYTAAQGVSSQVLTISGQTVTFNISLTPGNIITSDAGGIYATNRLSSFTQGNIVMSDEHGAPQDGNIKASEIIVDGDVATPAEVTEMLGEVFGTSGN